MSIHQINDQYQFMKETVQRVAYDSVVMYAMLMAWAWYCDLDLIRYHTTLSVVFLLALAWLYFEFGASSKRVLGRKYQSPMMIPFLMYCEKMYDRKSDVIQQGIVDEIEEMDYNEFRTVELQCQLISVAVALGLTLILFAPMMIRNFL